MEVEERSQKLHGTARSQSGEGLISEPIDVLMQRLEQEAFTRALQASSRGQSDVILLETPVAHERLWVDKYALNSFTKLLSDEQTNREVLLWLKQWDSCVFGSEIRGTTDEVLSALKRHSSITQRQKLSESKFPRSNRGSRWNNENFKHMNGMNHENTSSKSIQELANKSRCTGPPEQKILLLCGPPSGRGIWSNESSRSEGPDVEISFGRNLSLLDPPMASCGQCWPEISSALAVQTMLILGTKVGRPVVWKTSPSLGSNARLKTLIC